MAETTLHDLQDDRGVDVAAIRELLALTPAERVDRLMAQVATWTEILGQPLALPYLESLRDETSD